MVQVKNSVYHTIIVRHWQEIQTEGNGRFLHRYRLENPHTNEHWSFVDVDAALNFLRDYLEKQ
jgi:hypothetical protein